MRRAEEFATFPVEVGPYDDGVELRLEGDLDMGTARHLRQALVDARDQGARAVVIDLSQLDFIDSSGLYELVVARKRQRAVGGDVVLRQPTAHTRRVFEIVGLTELFGVD